MPPVIRSGLCYVLSSSHFIHLSVKLCDVSVPPVDRFAAAKRKKPQVQSVSGPDGGNLSRLPMHFMERDTAGSSGKNDVDRIQGGICQMKRTERAHLDFFFLHEKVDLKEE